MSGAPSHRLWVTVLREGVPGAGALCLSGLPHVVCGSLGHGKVSRGLRFHAQVDSVVLSVGDRAEGRCPRGWSFVLEWPPSCHLWVTGTWKGVPGAEVSCPELPHAVRESLGQAKMSRGLRFHARVGSLAPSVGDRAEERCPRG